MNENDYEKMQAASKAHEPPFTWGSFQYEDIAKQYEILCEQEKVDDRSVVLAGYGIQVGATVPFEGDLLKSFVDTICIDMVDSEIEGANDAPFREMLKDTKTVTAALLFLRSQAWDLWSAIPYIAKFVFPGLDMGETCHEHEIGVLCWLLKSYGYVEDAEPFKEWDT